MLNELHELAECLKAVGVSTESWHRHFKTCPKGTATFFAFIDASGQVGDLQPIADRARLATVRKWEVGAGDSFPAFNVPPLLEPRGSESKKIAGQLRKELASKTPPTASEVADRLSALIASSDVFWANKEAARITKCLTTIAADLSAAVGEPPLQYRAIAELASRANKTSAVLLHEQLQAMVSRKLIESVRDADIWFDVLFFYTGNTPKKLSLIIELADRSEFAYPAVHEEVQTWINSRLMLRDGALDGGGSPAEKVGIDAYAGEAKNLVESFPSVRLPVLGNVILRSMSSESPCQRRYGFADSASFPVGQSARQEMKNALEWIGDPGRRERTWCDVSSLNGASGVLFAYPSQKPETAPEVAGLIVGLTDESDPDGVRFEACASRVTKSLTALASDLPSTEVRIFVLTKPDGFRAKVLYSSRYTVNSLLESADAWKRDAQNIPRLSIRQFGPNRGDKSFWAEPLIPYPAEVVNCLNTAWERAGTHAEQTKGFGISDGLGLLLERGPELRTIASRAIRTLIVDSLSLVLALGQAHHQGDAHPLGKKHGKHALLLPGTIGLLLAKLGRPKGDYMRGPPFLIGRLFSLADQLHVQYCMNVRKKQVPRQLVGNALMATAAEQPERALAVLLLRILPYQSWARTTQGGDEVRLPKYLLGELGRVCAELKALQLPSKCSDAEKAEMLLGYLARSEKETSSPDTTNEKGDCA